MAGLAAVNEILPVPEAGRPMAVLLFVQLYVGLPEGLVNTTFTASPPQAVWSPGLSIVGLGLTVMVNVTGVPTQPAGLVGVTVMVPTSGLLTPAAVKLRLPEPEAGRPMAVLSFVHSKVAPELPVKLTVTCWPAQAVWLAGGLTVAAGLMVMVKVWAGPVQPFSVAVTEMVPVMGLAGLAAVNEMLPEPEAPRPMAVLLFVQLKVGFPAGLVKLTVTCWPAQAVWLPGLSTVGAGLTVMVNVTGVPWQLP